MMAVSALNPTSLKFPAGPYTHGLKVTDASEWLFTTGQVALAADGSIPEEAAAQSELVWSYLLALLRDAGMTVDNIIKTNVYAVSAEVMTAHNLVRNSVLGDSKPATTAVIVAGLANPKYLIEVDLVACK